jgi:glycosyltransferase involved in cell wall biosynthesis
MKLALCLEYPIDQHGGTEVLVSELIQGLGNWHEIFLVSADDDASFRKSYVSRLVTRHVSWQPQPHSTARARMLAETIAQFKPDLAHFHFGGNYAWGNRCFGQCPIIPLHRRGIRCLSTNHGAFTITQGYCGEQRSRLVKSALFLPAWVSKQVVLAHLQCEVTVSQHDYRAVRRWYPPMRHKFGQIYHSRIRNATPPVANPNRTKTVLCAGTIGPRKGQTFLVEAFCQLAARFPDWKLVLIGRLSDEPMVRRIRELVNQHNAGVQVQLLGQRTDAELLEWLKQSAIFVMPSLYEGLGLSLQEAQFYGCACVGTRCGGVEDLIQDGDNGLLVPAGQTAPLAEALARLMSDDSLRQRFSIRGPQSVLEKGMTAEKMVAAYERIYAEFIPPRSESHC